MQDIRRCQEKWRLLRLAGAGSIGCCRSGRQAGWLHPSLLPPRILGQNGLVALLSRPGSAGATQAAGLSGATHRRLLEHVGTDAGASHLLRQAAQAGGHLRLQASRAQLLLLQGAWAGSEGGSRQPWAADWCATQRACTAQGLFCKPLPRQVRPEPMPMAGPALASFGLPPCWPSDNDRGARHPGVNSAGTASSPPSGAPAAAPRRSAGTAGSCRPAPTPP